MAELMRLLLDRDAIPQKRLMLFTNPGFAEVRNKSPLQGFESNGVSGFEVFRNPHFIKYLRYFVQGPDLPLHVKEGLCKILNDDVGTSGMLLDQYRAYARASVRDHGLNACYAATEFFRLGVELGMEIGSARSLRDAAKSASGSR